ncbi:Metallo-dependent phosphatase-like protein, partial [Melampsora americana]
FDLFDIYLFQTNPTFLLFHFKVKNALVSSGWIGFHSIYIRKQPLIFIHSSQSVSIVWETNELQTSAGLQASLRYWTTSSQNQTHPITKTIIEPNRIQPDGHHHQRRWVHSTLLDHLIPGQTYTYQIILIKPNHPHSIKKVFSTHQFDWLGIDSPDLTQLHHLSSTSPKSVHPKNVLHIVLLGDNQFGLRTFHQLIKRLVKIKSYLPHFKSPFGPRQIIHHLYQNPSQPDLFFHLGDAVQDSHNLIQWQTDFWDPFTHRNPISSKLPILYTRGNHDFDPSGKNIKTLLTTRIEKPNSHSRATYHAYSPHPRVRVLVCDSNLEPTRESRPGSKLSEVDEHERWLLWEMARPEWKEASIRIILVHVPPFVEYWDPHMWIGAHENLWGQYVRTRFAPHFHATSTLTKRYDIPPASIVISGHSHAYSRGLLSNFVAESYFDVTGSGFISREVIRAAKAEHSKHIDPSSPQLDHGVVYVISGGGGGTLDKTKAEHWGFYERSIVKHHFGYMMIDIRDKRMEYKRAGLRVYKLIGSQLVCNGTN